VFAQRAGASAPSLGEHTREILEGIRMSESEIQELARQGILGL
jgi:crotonobetainyl-CoA:carnitine CoA-transferase CaiB-like acyl-CoA transferase